MASGDLGSFMAGLTQTLSASQERQMKRELLANQKKLIDAQIKGHDAEAEVKAGEAKMWLTELQKRGQPEDQQPEQPAMPQAAPSPWGGVPFNLPEGGPPASVPQMVAGASVQPPAGGVPASIPTGGNKSMITSELLMRGLIKKRLGIDPKENQQWRTVPRIDPKTGARGTVEKDLLSGTAREGSFVPDQVTPKTEKVTVGNREYYRDVNPFTGAQLGELRSAQEGGAKPLGATDANVIALTKNSLKDAQTAINALFGGTGANSGKMVSSFLNLPGTKGREFSQSWDRAVKPLMVALTGTGMSEREASNIISMSKPLPGDSSKAKQTKVESLVDFMQERLKLMDPTGEYGIVNVSLPWRSKRGLGKTPPNLGKQKDPMSMSDEDLLKALGAH